MIIVVVDARMMYLNNKFFYRRIINEIIKFIVRMNLKNCSIVIFLFKNRIEIRFRKFQLKEIDNNNILKNTYYFLNRLSYNIRNILFTNLIFYNECFCFDNLQNSIFNVDKHCDQFKQKYV